MLLLKYTPVIEIFAILTMIVCKIFNYNSVILTNIYIMFYYIKIYVISKYQRSACQYRR